MEHIVVPVNPDWQLPSLFADC